MRPATCLSARGRKRPAPNRYWRCKPGWRWFARPPTRGASTLEGEPGRGSMAASHPMQTGGTVTDTPHPSQPTLPIRRIVQGRNPRTYFDPDKMAELEEGIRAVGVLEPIVVRPIPGTDRYEIIAGERRWRAARNVFGDGYDMPVVIKDASDETAEAMSVIENYHREDMSPAEEAHAAQRQLLRQRGDKEETARLMGWSPEVLERRRAGRGGCVFGRGGGGRLRAHRGAAGGPVRRIPGRGLLPAPEPFRGTDLAGSPGPGRRAARRVPGHPHREGVRWLHAAAADRRGRPGCWCPAVHLLPGVPVLRLFGVRDAGQLRRGHTVVVLRCRMQQPEGRPVAQGAARCAGGSGRGSGQGECEGWQKEQERCETGYRRTSESDPAARGGAPPDGVAQMAGEGPDGPTAAQPARANRPGAGRARCRSARGAFPQRLRADRGPARTRRFRCARRAATR